MEEAGGEWTEESIRNRTQEMAEVIIQIWPVPPNHKSRFPDKLKHESKVRLSDPRTSEAAPPLLASVLNGWWFFLTDQASRRSLRMVRRDYVDAMAVNVEDDEADDDDEDD